jgi:hypothetical protein
MLDLTEIELKQLFRRVVEKHFSHCGLCCRCITKEDDGRFIEITAESCVCSDLAKECRKAAGMWPE